MCKSYSLYILFSLIIFQIVGCAPVAVVSAPVTFADRRASEIQYIDQKIEIKAILETQDVDQEDNLSFVSYNQIVLLTGEASSQEIVTKVADATSTEESGLVELKTATHDGSLYNGFTLQGGSVAQEVDVTIANGAASNTTIAGNLIVTSDLTVSGTTTTINTATLQVEDKNIVLNYNASSDTSGTADGAGITIQDAQSTLINFRL